MYIARKIRLECTYPCSSAILTYMEILLDYKRVKSVSQSSRSSCMWSHPCGTENSLEMKVCICQAYGGLGHVSHEESQVGWKYVLGRYLWQFASSYRYWPQLRSLWMNVTWIMQRHLINKLSHGHRPIRLCRIIYGTRHVISSWKRL
jgi:hypothetical protein